MASETSTDSSDDLNQADFAKAFQELAKGERAATALESQLSDMEKKIEDLVARAEKEQEELQRIPKPTSGSSGPSTSS